MHLIRMNSIGKKNHSCVSAHISNGAGLCTETPVKISKQNDRIYNHCDRGHLAHVSGVPVPEKELHALG